MQELRWYISFLREKFLSISVCVACGYKLQLNYELYQQPTVTLVWARQGNECILRKGWKRMAEAFMERSR